jgi:hypothetical protein
MWTTRAFRPLAPPINSSTQTDAVKPPSRRAPESPPGARDQRSDHPRGERESPARIALTTALRHVHRRYSHADVLRLPESMLARAGPLPTRSGWRFEPKLDGVWLPFWERKSPVDAPSGRVMMYASQNASTALIPVNFQTAAVTAITTANRISVVRYPVLNFSAIRSPRRCRLRR